MQIHTNICGCAVSWFTYCLKPVYLRVWQNSWEGLERDWSVKWLRPILQCSVFILSDNYHLSLPATTPLCRRVVSWMCYTNTINEPIWSGHQQFLNKKKEWLCLIVELSQAKAYITSKNPTWLVHVSTEAWTRYCLNVSHNRCQFLPSIINSPSRNYVML